MQKKYKIIIISFLLILIAGIFYINLFNCIGCTQDHSGRQAFQSELANPEVVTVAELPDPVVVLEVDVNNEMFLTQNAITINETVILNTSNGPSYFWSPDFEIPENADYWSFKFKYTEPPSGTHLTVSHDDELLFFWGGTESAIVDNEGFDEAQFVQIPTHNKAGQFLFAFRQDDGSGSSEVIIKDIKFYTIPSTNIKTDNSLVYTNLISGYSITIPAGWYVPRTNELTAKFYECPPRNCETSFHISGYTDLAKTHGLNSDIYMYEEFLEMLNKTYETDEYTITTLNSLIRGARVVKLTHPASPMIFYRVFFEDSNAMIVIEATDDKIEKILPSLKLL